MSRVSGLCSIPDCGKPNKTLGLCSMHYERQRVHGSPHGGKYHQGDALRYFNEVVLPYEGDECLIWPYTRPSRGYAAIIIEGRRMPTTRYLCEIMYGKPPTDARYDAAHSCGNGKGGCVTKRHLRWATRTENLSDRIGHGTVPRGRRNGQSKLTESDVREIRRLAGKCTARELAERFPVKVDQIQKIQQRKWWAWLP